MDNTQIPGADIAQQIVAANNQPVVEQPPQPESQLGTQISELSRKTGMDPAAIQMQLAKNAQQLTGSTNLAPVQDIQQLSMQNASANTSAKTPVAASSEVPSTADFEVPAAPTSAAVAAPSQPAPAATTTQQAYLAEFTNQQKAAENIAKAQKDIEDVKKEEYKNAERAAASTKIIVDDYRTKFDEEYGKRVGQLDASIAEFRKIAAEKPQTAQDIWEKKSTGQKISAGIAIALGGIGAALQGNGAVNQAYNIIQKGLQDEAEALNSRQKNMAAAEERAGKMAQEGLQMTKGYVAQGTEMLLTRKLMQYEEIENKLKSVAAQYQSPQIAANAQALMSKLQQDKLKTQMEFDQVAKQQAMMSSLGSMSAEDFSKLPPMMQAQFPKEVREQFKEASDTLVPGYGQATNKNLAQEFSKKRAEIEPAVAGAKRILQATKDLNRVTDLKRKAEIATELKALAGQLRVPFTGPGALTEKEYERLMDTLGDPTSVLSMPSLQKARLMTVLKKLEGDLGGSATAAGLKPKTGDTILREANFTPIIKGK